MSTICSTGQPVRVCPQRRLAFHYYDTPDDPYVEFVFLYRSRSVRPHLAHFLLLVCTHASCHFGLLGRCCLPWARTEGTTTNVSRRRAFESDAQLIKPDASAGLSWPSRADASRVHLASGSAPRNSNVGECSSRAFQTIRATSVSRNCVRRARS